MSLTSHQMRHLRSLAHHLKPVVFVGAAGISDGVVGATDDALEAHELIKVKIDGDREARATMSQELATRTRSEIAQTIGRVTVLFRPARAREARRITLPAR